MYTWLNVKNILRPEVVKTKNRIRKHDCIPLFRYKFRDTENEPQKFDP